MDLCNLSVIRELMSDAGITFRKEFGQNFLTNRMIPEDIADNCTDNHESMVLEIGPGIGCLTQELAVRYKKVVAVEIDRGLIPILGRTMSEAWITPETALGTTAALFLWPSLSS